MKHRYIYEIVNTTNGHTYVGQRSCDCLPTEDNYWGSGLLIKRAIKKHGLGAFKKVILEEGDFSKKALDERERFWIARRRMEGHAEYNVSPGGTGGDLLKDAPELKAEALRKNKEAHARWSPGYKAGRMEKLHERNRKYWAEMDPEQYAAVCKARQQAVESSYKDPEFYQRKCAINAKNAAVQSATQRSPQWIESVGHAAHSAQNIKLAKGFYKDKDGKLYTLSAVRRVLKCPIYAVWAFMANWEKRVPREQYEKWHARFEWVPNTLENDKLYNFQQNVITGCYIQNEEAKECSS